MRWFMQGVQGVRGVVALAVGVVVTGCGGGDSAAAVRIGGAVDHPADYSISYLAHQPVVLQTVSFSSGSGPQNHVYTGAPLWSVLNSVVLQLDASKKNDVLNRYVLATGADGYKTVFALGELHPDFGNKAVAVAYAETLNGASTDLPAADGPLRVTAPGDVKGGRYVSKLVTLDVRTSGSTVAGTSGGVAPSFTVSGTVSHSMVFDVAALKALTASSQTVGANIYTGVDLWSLLKNTAGLVTDATAKNPTLAMYAVATGSDGYKAVVSLGEIDPGFGNKPALVAYSVNGVDLGSSGAARLVLPGDSKQGRSVSNLVSIEVFKAP